MGGGASKWVRLYYLLGLSYYIYHWFLIGGGVGLLVALGTYSYGSAIIYTVVAAILSLALIALGTTIFVGYKGSNPGLKLLSSRTVYRVLADGKYQYSRHLEVEAAFDGIDHFKHVFGWTGQGKIDVAAENGHRAEIFDDDKSNDKTLRLSFSAQRKRAKFKLGYTFTMTDQGGRAKNFFRSTIHEKVRLLICEVEFAPDRCPAKYKKEIYMSPVASIPIFQETQVINREEHKITWTIRKPRFDYNYLITW